jgi:2-(1,2-epoxy-1,2-dihydrophenyl)acetyl-CoA isomerase
MSDEILCAVQDGVATITLNRPKVMNAFSDDMRGALHDDLAAMGARDDVGCIVITGAGKAFCAGGDIASMVALQDADDTSVVGRRIEESGRVLQRIREARQPVLAAINGAAAGAGINLALACDMRLASSAAIFSESFVKIGLVPDWGGFQSLTRLVGTARAMELMMTGDRFDAAEADRLGLLNRVIPAEDFAAEVKAFAHRLAHGPRAALDVIKRGVYLGETGSAADVLDFEAREQAELFLSDDAREGMRAFMEKRPAAFGMTGR